MLKNLILATPQPGNQVTVIEPPRGVVPLNVKELWKYRELLFFMIWRDMKARYKQSALGPLWIIINPLMQMVVLSVIFGAVARLPMGGIPPPLFIYSTILAWSFFEGGLFRASGSLRGALGLMSKIYFPRLIIPLTGYAAAFIDFLISFVILLGLCLYFGYALSWSLLLIPVFLFMAKIVGLTIGLAFAPATAHFWDVGNILSYFVKLLMYSSPIVYMANEVVPERWQNLYWMNPMANIIQACRWAILGTEPPDWTRLITTFAAVLPFFLLSALYYRRAERSIVDIA